MKNTFDFDKWYFIEHDPADHEAKKYYNNSKTNFAVRMKNKSFAIGNSKPNFEIANTLANFVFVVSVSVRTAVTCVNKF